MNQEDTDLVMKNVRDIVETLVTLIQKMADSYGDKPTHNFERIMDGITITLISTMVGIRTSTPVRIKKLKSESGGK